MQKISKKNTFSSKKMYFLFFLFFYFAIIERCFATIILFVK